MTTGFVAVGGQYVRQHQVSFRLAGWPRRPPGGQPRVASAQPCRLRLVEIAWNVVRQSDGLRAASAASGQHAWRRPFALDPARSARAAGRSQGTTWAVASFGPFASQNVALLLPRQPRTPALTWARRKVTTGSRPKRYMSATGHRGGSFSLVCTLLVDASNSVRRPLPEPGYLGGERIASFGLPEVTRGVVEAGRVLRALPAR